MPTLLNYFIYYQGHGQGRTQPRLMGLTPVTKQLQL